MTSAIRTVQRPDRDAESTHAKASKAEFAKDYNQAFRLYIKSAEAYIDLSRSTTATEREKQLWKSNASKALERAELIKKFVDASRNANAASGSSLRLTPVGINYFSQQEQSYVLRRGSRVNGLLFPLWDEPVAATSSGNVNYIDPDGQPKLSPEQEKVYAVWRRATRPDTETNRRILPQEILQHVVTDCSVCASVSVCLEHARRFDSELAVSSITQTRPGRYDAKIHFNGSWRRIAVDDQLPFHPTKEILMCMSILASEGDLSEESKTVLWPSLLEKAYMKLMGGYDFPGSNSSIDLHAFTGWIPEHIDIKRSGFEREKSWERIEAGFSSGQCLVTLGTGPNEYIRWRDVSLLPSHSYAVIGAEETPQGRIFTVLDSWVRLGEDHNAPSRKLKIPWSEVLNTFDGVYLSWAPSSWPQTLTFHGMWKRTDGDSEGTRHLQIEFRNSSTVEEEVWILLTRHVVDTRRATDYMALNVDLEDDLILNATILDSGHSSALKGTYTNSTQFLTRTRISPQHRSGVLSVCASYEGDAQKVGFTLTAYAKNTMKVSWIEREDQPMYPPKKSGRGRFSYKNAGGNCKYPTFMVNPQYRLVIHPTGSKPEKVRVTLMLRCGKDLPVNVAMVWSQGQRVSEFPEKDLVSTSGAYSYGLARASKAVLAGEYTIVVSAFEPHHLGSFTLNIDCSQSFEVYPIPQEDAGMYTRVVRGCWDKNTSGGAPSFDRYTKNPAFELDLPASAQIKIRLQLLQQPIAALNVAVYPTVDGDPVASITNGRHIMASEGYDNALAGVATQQVTLVAGKYFIIPSTFNPGTEAAFSLTVYSTIPGVGVRQARTS